MARVVVSRVARLDLIGIRDYIAVEPCNPDAAARILARLRAAIEALRDYRERGKPLDAVLPVHTEYRFLVCENYRIFYLLNGDQVEIIRVLHTLQDYMRALFLES